MRPGLRSRALDFFVEPREAPPAAPAPGPREPARFLAPVPPRSARPPAATRLPLRAAVLGAAPAAVPMAALLANALRAASGAPAAALAVWAPGATAARGGPATFAAARLAGRLAARELPAVARGRLAWLALDDHPVGAAVAARRAGGALELPLVVVLAGPRCEVVEGLLGEQDLVIVATDEPDGPLSRLAVAGCAAAGLACAPPAPGPPRWLARTGLSGPRRLPSPLRALVRDLASPPQPERPAREPVEPAW